MGCGHLAARPSGKAAPTEVVAMALASDGGSEWVERTHWAPTCTSAQPQRCRGRESLFQPGPFTGLLLLVEVHREKGTALKTI